MSSRVKNYVVLAAAVILVFGVTAAIGLKLAPEPHTDTDYLVIGSISTLLALAALFGVLLVTVLRGPGALVRRRPKTRPAGADAPANPDIVDRD
jgi:hypothetical protein